ncbi:DUF4037 domain-containing protein [Brachybacterium hainanense]|uniref:DUF4037 domain-containing protein n=1 Tax=Brachybacterium hainanense TaxID=1541174 RepID=A0ABV6RB48_9MICO
MSASERSAAWRTGREMARAYHREVVRPLLERSMPGLAYAAGRLGTGSDVLGYDDPQSADHDFGLRMTLLVEDGWAQEVDSLLERALPPTHHGMPTRFAMTGDPRVRHRCEVASARDLAVERLGVDPSGPMSLADWRSLTGQSVLELTAGPVFHDGTGAITAIRETLTWYPRDVWLHALAADWSRLGQEMPDVGRAGLRGDEDGSAVIAARHVRTILHLAHLIHRRWPPYGKWLARSAAQLPGGQELRGILLGILRSTHWQERQELLAGALEQLAAAQSRMGLPVLLPATEAFFDRPHIGVREIAEELHQAIEDPAVRAIPCGIGTAEQISDNVTVLVDPARRRHLVA